MLAGPLRIDAEATAPKPQLPGGVEANDALIPSPSLTFLPLWEMPMWS